MESLGSNIQMIQTLTQWRENELTIMVSNQRLNTNELEGKENWPEITCTSCSSLWDEKHEISFSMKVFFSIFPFTRTMSALKPPAPWKKNNPHTTFCAKTYEANTKSSIIVVAVAVSVCSLNVHCACRTKESEALFVFFDRPFSMQKWNCAIISTDNKQWRVCWPFFFSLPWSGSGVAQLLCSV